MPTYTAPTKDMQFLLHEVLNVSAASTSPAMTSWTATLPRPCWKRLARSANRCWPR